MEISTNYKESFAQCLEPITASLRPQSSVSSTSGNVRTTNLQTSNTSSLLEAPSSSSSKGGGPPFSSSGYHKRSTSSGAQNYVHSSSQRYWFKPSYDCILFQNFYSILNKMILHTNIKAIFKDWRGCKLFYLSRQISNIFSSGWGWCNLICYFWWCNFVQGSLVSTRTYSSRINKKANIISTWSFR